VGWDSKAEESHTDKLLRASVLGLLDTFAWDEPAVASEAKRRFDAHWEDPSALPAEYKVVFVCMNVCNVCVCMYACMYECMYVCVNVCIHVCMCECMYACM
jgi:hypothetical protein